MSTETRHVTVVYGGLLVLTLAALWFLTDSSHDLLSGRGAAAGAAAIAFVKAWLVARDFMELRGTVLWRWVNAWFALVGTVCLVLVLR